MKYLVMEVHPGYCVVLDEAGTFHRAANLGYETGDRIENVVLMQEDGARTGDRRIRKIAAAAALVACMALVLTPVINVMQQEHALIHLSINPEVTIEVDEDNEVTDMEAGNRDGRELIKGCTYHDKHVETVMDDLVKQAIRLGFLSNGELISLDVDADDETWGQELGAGLAEHLDDSYDGRYSIDISVNGRDFINRHVIVHDERSTSVPDESDESTDTPDRSTDGSMNSRSYNGGGRAYGASDYGDSGYSGGGNAVAAPTQAPAPSITHTPTQAPTQSQTTPNHGGDSGYGDSGYDAPDSGGDSGYEGDSLYD